MNEWRLLLRSHKPRVSTLRQLSLMDHFLHADRAMAIQRRQGFSLRSESRGQDFRLGFWSLQEGTSQDQTFG